jgi:hypothetical protein
MKITGGCLCRDVRYESTSEPIVARVCWCRVCQYLGAGSGTVNVCFATASFTIHGETGDYRSVADSGNMVLQELRHASVQRGGGAQLGLHRRSNTESRPATPAGGMMRPEREFAPPAVNARRCPPPDRLLVSRLEGTRVWA